MTAEYLTEWRNELAAKATTTKKNGFVVIAGDGGVSTLYKNPPDIGGWNVYFFFTDSARSDGSKHYTRKIDAQLAALEWAVKGRI